MAKEKFLLVSLKESKAKKLAQVISNETCRKILDYLAEKEATETELAKKLSIPISTAHYNLQCLMDGGLVIADEFHYSEKGKEVLHYKLANKYIIIAPKTVYGIKEKLKSVLPVTLLVAATAGIIGFVQNKTATFGAANIVSRETFTETFPKTVPIMRKAISDATMEAAEGAVATTGGLPEAAPVMHDLARETTNVTVDVVKETIRETVVQRTTPNIALWFLVGALSAIIIYMIVDYVRNRKK